jgi:cold shock CspA family protein
MKRNYMKPKAEVKWFNDSNGYGYLETIDNKVVFGQYIEHVEYIGYELTNLAEGGVLCLILDDLQGSQAADVTRSNLASAVGFFHPNVIMALMVLFNAIPMFILNYFYQNADQLTRSEFSPFECVSFSCLLGMINILMGMAISQHNVLIDIYRISDLISKKGPYSIREIKFFAYDGIGLCYWLFYSPLYLGSIIQGLFGYFVGSIFD